jgi:hypothetical protein
LTDKAIIGITSAVATVLTVGLNTIGQLYVIPHPEPEAKVANERLEVAYDALKRSFDAQAERLDQLAGAQATTHGWLEGLRWHIEQMEGRINDRLVRLHPRRSRSLPGVESGVVGEQPAKPPPLPKVRAAVPKIEPPEFEAIQRMQMSR